MEGEHFVYLTRYKQEYELGQYFRLSGDIKGKYIMVQVDATIMPSLVYMKNDEWIYHIPFEAKAKKAWSPNAFAGKHHYVFARLATNEEVNAYQNLAFNAHDQKQDSGAYPHSYANVETRDESVFYARNAIDGIYANDYHGKFPYQSWGINRDPEAEFSLDFGRLVNVDKIGITLRCDFPHDSYWTEGTITFDNGFYKVLKFKKEQQTQYFNIETQKISRLKFHNLIKHDDDSPFPALTQIELWGYNIE